MPVENMSIRVAASRDREQILELHRAAFDASENERVARLALELLDEDESPGSLSLVAESEGAVVGHIAFSPVGLSSDARFRGFLLGPLGVRPEFQARGIGSALVREGIRQLTDANIDVLLVYGDPAYYGRFGFSAEAAAGLAAPYPLQFDFGWQAMFLHPRDETSPRGEVTCVAALNDPSLW